MGISHDDITTVVKLSAFIKGKAASHVEHLAEKSSRQARGRLREGGHRLLLKLEPTRRCACGPRNCDHNEQTHDEGFGPYRRCGGHGFWPYCQPGHGRRAIRDPQL